MVSFRSEEFEVYMEKGLPPAVLKPCFEIPKYGRTDAAGRIVITTSEENCLPQLFQEAVKEGLISQECYDKEREYLKHTHGVII